MNNKDFWISINQIISDGFNSGSLQILDNYAEQFINGKLVYHRFSQAEQYGCAAGGLANVIASILAGANVGADSNNLFTNDFKRECELGKAQEQRIEQWARKANLWVDSVDVVLERLYGQKLAEGGEAGVYQQGVNLIKSIGLDYYLLPILALDRISLHNAFFPETRLFVVGFGRNQDGKFQIIVEQSFIQGNKMSDDEISDFAIKLGFKMINPKNWTFATPKIYLSDLHDENLIRSNNGNIFVIDCDIRINVPELRCEGVRNYSNEVTFR